MAPIDDDTLDKLLTRHLSARLDGQAGRAEAAFRRWVADDPTLAARGAAVATGSDLPGGAAGNEAAPLPPPLRLAGGGPGAGGPPGRLSPAAPPSGGRARWAASIVGTAIAASLATLMVLPHVSALRPTPGGPGASTPKTDRPDGVAVTPPSAAGPAMQHYVHSRFYDEGTVAPADPAGPLMRQVREQQFEHRRWYDPQRHATTDVVVPREQIRQYKLETYLNRPGGAMTITRSRAPRRPAPSSGSGPVGKSSPYPERIQGASSPPIDRMPRHARTRRRRHATSSASGRDRRVPGRVGVGPRRPGGRGDGGRP